MKKILVIIGIIVAFLVAAMAVIPIFFKDAILEKAKTTINRNIDAEVQFSGFNLSLFRSFPKVSLEITGLTVTGKEEFKNDTLFSVPSLRTNTSLLQLFKKENMSIDEIILTDPRINLVVGTSGNVNWDIAGETDSSDVQETDEGLELKLEKIDISGADFLYDDRELNMQVLLDNINIDVSGKMYGTATELQVEGSSESFSLFYGGTGYISNVALETVTLLNVDYDKMDISIIENELLVNRLPLEVKGLIRMPDDTIHFDMNLVTKESGFDNFLALVPPDYEHYLKEINTSGTALLSGVAKGYYIEEEYPELNLKLTVNDGTFHYANLPEEIKNISADIEISKPQGNLDLTEIMVRKAHAEVKNNPVDISLVLRNPVSDLFFDGSLTGNINFDDLKDALPLDSINISGVVDANLMVNGTYSSVEKEDYSKIKSEGAVVLSDFVFDMPGLTQTVYIPEGRLGFTPQSVNLAGMQINVGQSDFLLSGRITDYLDYILTDGILRGNLQLNSRLVNLNELLKLQIADESSSTADTTNESAEKGDTLVFSVPKDIDFTFQSDIKKVIFDRVNISDVNGLITARNGKIILDGLNMHMLDGELKLTGSYENTPENQPLFDFGFEIIKFDIPETFNTILALRSMIPIARQSQGSLSSSLKLNGQLSPSFKLLPSSIDGSGLFSTESLMIVESPLFASLKGLLKPDLLKNIKVDDFNANIEIVEGGIVLKPFTTRIAGQQTTISGNVNTQNLLDMRLDFNVERAAFGPDIENILGVLPGQERIQMIPASVVLKGPVGKPEVKVDLEAARKQITEEVKKSAKEDLQKSLNKLGEGLKKLLK